MAPKVFLVPGIVGLALLASFPARADQVVQIPVDTLLTARAVTTLTQGKLVPWTMGIDGGGAADGYMTAAASKFHGDPPNLKALPDDGKFAANARHPEVVLHFSNDADPMSQQTYWVKGMGSFTFMVPPAPYSQMFLFFTSAEGGSALKVSLVYTDATDTSTINVPDYYADVAPTDPVLFNLASDLPKWTKTGTVAEANHHNLTGVEMHPAAGKVLSSIKVEKGAAAYLVFWGATGVATSTVVEMDAGLGRADGEAGIAVDEGGGGAGGSSVTGSGGGVGQAGMGGASGYGGSVGPDSSTPKTRNDVVRSDDSGCACSLARRDGRSATGVGLGLLMGAMARFRRRSKTMV